MRVLISGGKKTINIVNPIKERFASGSVELTMEEDIDNIESFLSRGEYFDKALILEQSWTKDGAQADESKLRASINNFVNIVRQKCSKECTYIFIASTEQMARVALEETLELSETSRVLLKAPPYYVSFFTLLIKNELQDIPEQFIFKLDDTEDVVEPQDEQHNFKERLDKVQEIEEESLEESVDEALEDIDSSGSEEATITDLDDEFFNVEARFEDIDNSEGFGDAIEDGYDFSFDDDGLDMSDFDSLGDGDGEDMPSFDFTDGIDNVGVSDIQLEDSDIKTKSSEVQLDTEGLEDDDNDTWGDSIDIDDIGELDSDSFDVTNNTNGERGNEEESVVSSSIGNEVRDSISSQHRAETIPQGFTDEDYKKPDKKVNSKVSLNNIVVPSTVDVTRHKKATKQTVVNGVDKNYLDSVLNALSSKGASIVVTGVSGSGVTTVAHNIANTLVKLGYSVLLVDMDTRNRAQAYISKDTYDTVHSHDTANASLKMAINSAHLGVGRFVNIVSPAFHLLTMGLAGDIVENDELATKDKLMRFSSVVRSSYNFIVYDIPFDKSIEYCSDIVCSADNIIMTMDSSNWGVMKTLISMSNIPTSDMRKVMFTRPQICITKYRPVDKILGSRVKSLGSILSNMDSVVEDLIGAEAEFNFCDMQICGVLPYDELYEKCWFDRSQYSDYESGYIQMIGLLNNVYVKK